MSESFLILSPRGYSTLKFYLRSTPATWESDENFDWSGVSCFTRTCCLPANPPLPRPARRNPLLSLLISGFLLSWPVIRTDALPGTPILNQYFRETVENWFSAGRGKFRIFFRSLKATEDLPTPWKSSGKKNQTWIIRQQRRSTRKYRRYKW